MAASAEFFKYRPAITRSDHRGSNRPMRLHPRRVSRHAVDPEFFGPTSKRLDRTRINPHDKSMGDDQATPEQALPKPGHLSRRDTFRLTKDTGIAVGAATIAGATAVGVVRTAKQLGKFLHKEAGTPQYYQEMAQQLFNTVPEEQRIAQFRVAYRFEYSQPLLQMEGANIRKSPTQAMDNHNLIGSEGIIPKGLELTDGILVRGNPAGPSSQDLWIIFPMEQLRNSDKGIKLPTTERDTKFAYINFSNINPEDQQAILDNGKYQIPDLRAT